MEASSGSSDDIINKYDGVILRKDSFLKYVKVVPGRQERMTNFKFVVDNMIGREFGLAYEVQGTKLIQIDPRKYELEDFANTGHEEERDNRSLNDDAAAQKMSRDDIMKLKMEGVDGQEIIEKLKDSSDSFKQKTLYSQAKYLKKKKKKHLAYFTTHKPTARHLCQLYFTQASTKILEMRPDTLAQILTWADVKYGSKVLVAETCQGLVLGAVLERLGEYGTIIHAYNGNCPVRIILNRFNFSENKKSKQVCGFSFESLEAIRETIATCAANEPSVESTKVNIEETKDTMNDENVDNPVSNKCGEVVKDADEDMEEKNIANIEDSGPCNKYYTKEKRDSEEKAAASNLINKDLDALIIATKFHPLQLLEEMIEFIKPSAPIVIYCQYKEPLMQCYTTLRDASLAINVHITETWCREIQVLENRTHPVTTISGRSGYVLRALKIKPNEHETSNDYEPQSKSRKM